MSNVRTRDDFDQRALREAHIAARALGIDPRRLPSGRVLALARAERTRIARIRDIDWKRLAMQAIGSEAAPAADRALPEPFHSASTWIQWEGWEAFRTQLPELLRHVPDKWVAFHGSSQVGLADSKHQVYRQLEEAACPLDEIIVRRVSPLRPRLDLRRFKLARSR